MAVSDPSQPTGRGYHVTTDRFLIGLLAVEGLFLLSERFQWFGVNEKKGYTLLITIATVAFAVVLMLLWFVVSVLRRWRFQFRMRSVLVLVLLVAIPLCWFATSMRGAKRQQAAITAIAKAGGETVYHWQIGISNAKPPGPAWLHPYLGVDFFSHVYGVQQADPFGSAVPVWKFQDDDMAHVKIFTELVLLAVSEAPISDSGLANVARLTAIEYLGLNRTRVTDAGLIHLRRLANLKNLRLAHTRITDAGLNHLMGLSNLQILALTGTQVSDEGLNRIRKSLPNCEILR